MSRSGFFAAEPLYSRKERLRRDKSPLHFLAAIFIDKPPAPQFDTQQGKQGVTGVTLPASLAKISRCTAAGSNGPRRRRLTSPSTSPRNS